MPSSRCPPHYYACGHRHDCGPGGFPSPLIEADNISIYSWAEISEWLRTKMRDDIPQENPDVALADALVKVNCRARAAHREDGLRHLFEAIA
ncbi:hypothetical protein ACTMTI_35940 [Nonomuraea sp. H19]|uniref:hypothetical protein n=1 Tax=Nonomuraea sp. H19 TaxID=3452206 RepID=UPI003F89AF64